GVLAVVAVGAAAGAGAVADLVVAAVAVDVEDLAGVVGVLVGDLEDGPGADAAAAVGVDDVAADGFVQRAAQLVGAGGVHAAVVPAAVAAPDKLHLELDRGVRVGRGSVEVGDEACIDLQRAGLPRNQRLR